MTLWDMEGFKILEMVRTHMLGNVSSTMGNSYVYAKLFCLQSHFSSTLHYNHIIGLFLYILGDVL